MSSVKEFELLLKEIRACSVCKAKLDPSPVLTASVTAKIVVIGQAPGAVVHRTKVPWDDKSGDNLRSWMQVDKSVFYNDSQIALIPMGFCYPGTGKSGDLPPSKECAPMWHQELFNKMPEVKLIILTGAYAISHYLGSRSRSSLTETVKNYEEYMPQFFVLPHPSPRNNIWQAKNPWFKENVLPVLPLLVKQALA